MLLEPREYYDKTIVGVLEIPNSPSMMLLYDKGLVLKSMVEDQGMEDIESAVEFYEYNTLGAWVGETTPAFVLMGEGKDFILEYMQQESDTSVIAPGLEDAVIGVYERCGQDQTVVYDKFKLTPEQRKTLSVVDTTQTAILEFKGGVTIAPKQPKI